MQKAALYTAGVFFAAAAVFHVIRLITGIEIVTDDFAAAINTSWSA